MGTSSTTLKPGDNLPSRGRSNKTRILEALRKISLEGLTEDSTKDEAETAFFTHIAKRAMLDEKESATLLKVLADKGWANVKPVYDSVSFEFDRDAKPCEQANQVIKAASSGEIPPDIAQVFITSIKAMIDIEEATDLKKRIEQLEEMLGAKSE